MSDTLVSKTVHEIFLSQGLDDPDIFVAEPILEWQKSDRGKYIMEHSNPAPILHKATNYLTMEYEYRIVTSLTLAQWTYYKLRYE